MHVTGETAACLAGRARPRPESRCAGGGTTAPFESRTFPPPSFALLSPSCVTLPPLALPCSAALPTLKSEAFSWTCADDVSFHACISVLETHSRSLFRLHTCQTFESLLVSCLTAPLRGSLSNTCVSHVSGVGGPAARFPLGVSPPPPGRVPGAHAEGSGGGEHEDRADGRGRPPPRAPRLERVCPGNAGGCACGWVSPPLGHCVFCL